MIDEQRSPVGRSLENKVRRRAQELDKKLSVQGLSTRDEIFNAVNATLADFYRALRLPETERFRVKHQDKLSPRENLEMTRAALNDLQYSYDRVEETQAEILRRSNRYTNLFREAQERITNANNVVSSVSRISEENRFEIADSFNDTGLLDTATGTLFVNEVGGLLTLPQLGTEEVQVVSARILDSSNGIDDFEYPIENLIDGNADTWFEYVRSGDEDDDPLNLEILLTLKNVTVVNQIEISPMILDDRAFANIVDIETSLDGRLFRSITDSLPSPLTKDEEDALFILGPVGFRNSSSAEFTLTPRTIQYVKIKIRQGKKVDRGNSTLLRIALQDIAIRSIAYDEEGDIESINFPLPFEAREILVTERSADTSPLTDIFFQASFDSGATFVDLVPGESLEVNTGGDGAIETAVPPISVKMRVVQRRDKTRFNGLARPLANRIDTIQERFTVDATPVSLGLQNVPLDGTLAIYQSNFAVGQDFGLPLFTAQGEDSLVIDLPVELRTFSETIKVNGEPWTRVNSLSNSGPDDRHYTINYAERKIRFGDSKTSIAPQGEITMELSPEPVLLPDTSPFNVDLDFTHDFNAESIKIQWFDRPRRSSEEFLVRGTNQFQLRNWPVINSQVLEEDVPVNAREFFLQNIPVDNSPLEFSDKTRFATQVFRTPTAAGEYQVTQLVSGLISPVKINTFTVTDGQFPGTVKVNAKAKIIDPQGTYDSLEWEKAVNSPTLDKLSTQVVPLFPQFSDTTVFSREVSFIDGVTELDAAGDYSINYDTGTVYSFSTTADTGLTHVIYSYQLNRNLSWEFTDRANRLIINDDSFLVNRNDQFNVSLLEDDNTRSYVVFKNNHWIRIPIVAISPYVEPATGQGIEFTDDDLLKAATLPVGKTRVRLEHQSIVKNTVRFIFLSDDINAFNDRIVSTDDSGNPVVSPKPVKDVFGDPLTPEVVGVRTQRDVDKTVLTRERVFINGAEELEQGGDYSIDYESGILYTFDPIPEHTIIQYEYADVRVSYIATTELIRDQQYVVDAEALEVNILGLGKQEDFSGADLLFRYEVIDQLKEDPVRVLQYFTPILMGYQVKVKP